MVCLFIRLFACSSVARLARATAATKGVTCFLPMKISPREKLPMEFMFAGRGRTRGVHERATVVCLQVSQAISSLNLTLYSPH